MKRYTNRLVAGLLVLLMLVAALPVAAFAETTEPEGKSDVENVQAHETKENEALETSEAGTPPAVRAPAPTTTKDLTVKVTLDTKMFLIMGRNHRYTFLVNGKPYTISVTENEGLGPKTFQARFQAVPFQDGQTQATVELKSLPTSIARYHTVVEQNYDPDTNKLHVTLGRNIYIRVFHLGNDVGFDDFAIMNNIYGCEMRLYTLNGEEIQTGQPAGDYGYQFKGITPGQYKVKITKLPSGEDYDIGREYLLDIAEDGSSELEIYQKDGNYRLARYIGMSGNWGTTGPQDGVKSPQAICLAKKSKAKKKIVHAGELSAKLEVEKNQIVEYKITKTIYPDHNTVVNFRLGNSDFTNIGAYVDQGFTDFLDKDLTLEGSINVTLGGQPTTDFEAKYDEQSHSVIVEDKTKVKVNSLNYGETTNIGEPQELVVTFKVKVLKAEHAIVNKVDDSTTELIPFKVKVKVNKIWQDNDDQAGKRPTSVTIVLKGDGVEKDRHTVTEGDNWEWTFTGLPKKNAAGNDIVYTVEELHVDGYKSKTTGDATQGFTVTNTLKPTVEVTAKKVWVGDANRTDARPASIEFILKADGMEKTRKTVGEGEGWQWTFRNLPKENDDGNDIVYTIEEVPVEGYKTTIAGDAKNGFTVTNRLIPPPPTTHPKEIAIPVEKVWEDDGNREKLRPTSVTVRLYADGKDTGKSVVLTETNDWKGKFLHLPEFNAGKKIVYTIEEERVAQYASTVTGNQTDGFTVTNRVEEPPKPPKPPTPPTPPITPTPPVIIVPRIPRAGVGA